MAVNAKNVIKPGETEGMEANTATSSSRRGKNA